MARLLRALPVAAVVAFAARHGMVAQSTLARHPSKPGCLQYRGKPIVLITATEHYGAVLNGKFDYVRYLGELQAHGLNLSRAFTFYREDDDSIPELGFSNTLAPPYGDEVLPWKRAGPGRAPDGGLKFDLNQWNPDYFARFKDFLRQAERRGVIVEVTLLCNAYTERRSRLFPYHYESNVNGVGKGITEFKQFIQPHDATVFALQGRFVQKVVQELNEFDNFYFEILNEGMARNREDAAREHEWQRALCDVIRRAENRLPKKHLIAINAHQQVEAYVEDGRRYQPPCACQRNGRILPVRPPGGPCR